MPDDVKISEMSEAASLDNSAQFPYVQSMNGTLTTLKAPLSQIGTKLNEGMTFSNLQTTSKNIVGAINEAAQGGGVEYATELPISSTDPTNTKSYIDTKTTLVKSASGSLIHITDGGDNISLKSCEITIAPDLTGKTEANLVVCGKNLFSQSLELGSIDANGQNSGDGSSVRCRTIGYISIPNSTLIVSNNLNAIVGCFYYDTNKTFISLESWESSPKVLNIPDNAKFVRFVFQITASNMPTQCQLEKGNQATAYEQYNGTTYNIPFGQTVTAGGTLDVISGELVVGGVTTQLTPVSPKTISGENNIYNDCGDTDIEYFTSSADDLAALFEVLSNS